MKLTLEQIKSITLGAVHVEQENDKIRFHRFTEQQEILYGKGSNTFNVRCAASAGIRLRFKTNSQTLKMKFEIRKGSSRQYYSFDVFVNGKAAGYMDNFSGVSLPQNYTGVELPRDKAEKEFALGRGDKEVCVYLPWSVCPLLEELSLEEGSCVIPVKPGKKLLAFGDSITQGYDALRSSMRYTARLADKLRAEELNKGIGGEVFIPALAQIKDDISPDYITVAYGTNDWSKKTEEDFKVRCREFFTVLSNHYPRAKIFAITPIWRKDCQGERAFGPFELVEKDIWEAVSDLPNVTVIPGFDLVPKDETYFSDLRLHPNDEGFAHYAENLYNEMYPTLYDDVLVGRGLQ